MSNYKLVIIDDEPMVIKGLSQLVPWDEIGCEVVATGEDGETGVELVGTFQPDIVISDIQMPKLSGLEMIKAIKSQREDVKFILLTGYRQFEYAKEAIDLGVTKFLLKPSNIEEIKKAVVQLIQEIEVEQSRVDDMVALRKKLALLEETTEVEDNESAIDANVIEQPESHKMKHLTKQAISYMKAHYAEKIDLQTVADQLYISIWYLSKLFKKEIGISFIEVLNEIRINEAKRMLTETNLKIYEIGEMVGYTDNPYFTKTFKKFVGSTPNQYRNT